LNDHLVNATINAAIEADRLRSFRYNFVQLIVIDHLKSSFSELSPV